MDAVPVEVAAGAVVVLGGARVGVPGEDLGVAQGDAGVEGVRDRGVPQRMRADVRQASRTRRTGTVRGMVAGLLPLPTRCSTRYPRRVSA